MVADEWGHEGFLAVDRLRGGKRVLEIGEAFLPLRKDVHDRVVERKVELAVEHIRPDERHDSPAVHECFADKIHRPHVVRLLHVAHRGAELRPERIFDVLHGIEAIPVEGKFFRKALGV